MLVAAVQLLKEMDGVVCGKSTPEAADTLLQKAVESMHKVRNSSRISRPAVMPSRLCNVIHITRRCLLVPLFNQSGTCLPMQQGLKAESVACKIPTSRLLDRLFFIKGNEAASKEVRCQLLASFLITLSPGRSAVVNIQKMFLPDRHAWTSSTGWSLQPTLTLEPPKQQVCIYLYEIFHTKLGTGLQIPSFRQNIPGRYTQKRPK